MNSGKGDLINEILYDRMPPWLHNIIYKVSGWVLVEYCDEKGQRFKVCWQRWFE